MELIETGLQQYAEKYTFPVDPLLQELEQFTAANREKAHMLSGPIQGAFLSMISVMLQPERILEIGTFTGYSALCLAKGLGEGGRIHTVELRAEESVAAKSFFDRSKYRDQIILHTGEALEIIDSLNETWDLVFIDADKTNYINYFNRVLPKVRRNGIILADNVFFHGQVLEEKIRGKNAKAIQAFNDYVLNREDVEAVMLPLRDGIYLIRKH